MKELRTLGGILTLIVAITMFFSLAINLISLIYSIPMIRDFTANPANERYLRWPFFLVTPFRIDIFILDAEMIYLYFILGFIIITVSIILIFYQGVEFLLKGINKAEEAWKSSPISNFVELLSISLFTSVIAVLISEALGQKPSAPSIEDLPIEVQMYALEFASFHEELITRVLLIGVPLFIYNLVKKDMKLALRVLPGGFASNRKLTDLEISLLVISSAIFGIAHVFGGWGLWKMFPTFVAGIALGYLYIKYGLHLSICAHFLVDYLTISLWFLEKYPNLIIFIGLLSLMFLLWIMAGGIYLIKYSFRVFATLKTISGFAKEPSEEDHREYQPYFYLLKCPVCRYSVFRYTPEGHIFCIRCGFRVYPPLPPPPWYFEYRIREIEESREIRLPPPP